MTSAVRPVRTITADEAGDMDALLALPDPVIVKGLAWNWALVRAGLRSTGDALDYLKGLDTGRPVTVYSGPPAIGGRFFYDAGLTSMNFTRGRAPLVECLDRLRREIDMLNADALYIGSADIEMHLAGFEADNPLPMAGKTMAEHVPLASIWIGNRTIASAHWDMSNNIAVCAVGHRRFTLFPPDQAANLYPGPLEPTPGGQVVSMVDFTNPDLARHPGFREARAAAQVADLEPGDVLIYPALWWHQVEAFDAVNVLVNYWWNAAEPFMDTPMTTLLHGMLALRDRPMPEKQAWRTLFDYYVFGPADRPAAHLPVHAQGPLAPLDMASARRLRAQILQRLNR